MSVLEAGRPLDRKTLVALFKEIGQQLQKQGHIAEIAIFGGSAIALLFDFRNSTQDVDYIPISLDMSPLKNLTEEIGIREKFSSNWFNDAIDIYASDDNHHLNLFGEYPLENPGLRVFTADPHYILSMKMAAMRSSLASNDMKDVWHLLDICQYKTLDQALGCYQNYFPKRKIPKRNLLLLADVFEAKDNGKAFDPVMGW